MPSGKVHLKLWKMFSITAIGAAGVGLVFIPTDTPPWAWLIGPFILIGYLLGYYLDPDWDQGNNVASQWRIQRHLSILGAFLVGWFMPYSKVFPHRSFWTHFPGVSTTIRLVWLSLFPPILFTLWILFGAPRTLDQINIPSYFIPSLIGLTIGLSLSDSIHYLADLWY